MLNGHTHHLTGLPADHVQFIEGIISRHGPEPEEYEALSEWFAKTAQSVESGLITREAVTTFWREVTHALFPESLQGHVVRKPHGYAGDFEIIDRIYLHHISEDEHLKRWDAYFHAQAAPRAVRNRKSYFHEVIRRKLSETSHRPLKVLNVASGPARDVAEWCAAHGTDDVHFHCVDLDANAIAHASQICAPYAGCVRFTKENALRFTTGERYDLVWSAGLFDYLHDELFQRLIKRLTRFVKDGGELVVGNFCEANTTRVWMEMFGSWNLYHRSATELLALTVSTGVSPDKIRIDQEQEGVNLFLHVTSLR